MTDADATSRLPDMEALWALAERFEAARADDPALAGAGMDDMLRLVPGQRAVCRGHIDGRPCVWRFFLDGHDTAAAREWAELQRIWPEMNKGPFRVVEPLYFSPEHGMIAVQEVEGKPLFKLLWKAPPRKRAQWLDPAAQWLRQYTESSESWQEAGHIGWLQRAERAARKQPFEELRKLEAAILSELGRLARQIDGIEWRVAISHGDFHPNNLIACGGTLTGIDTGGSAKMPIYKDIARFLMHMGRRGMIPSGHMYLGVDRMGLEAFAERFAMSGTERLVIMPFMLGIEALLRVETPALSDSRIRRARRMSAALLEDLRAL
ncbi:phosphotransferase [Roseovarius sp. PS-C2]|uniref:phosphotransferase n=1 Tax=Roseovarius sp. PS-C2 TaxID=2820814 RepID=UPI00209A7B9C|nr:phosphotransferase [Roseovarius sp. PS-C2]